MISKVSKTVVTEFVYLKNAEVNKKITILINNFNSPEAKRHIDFDG